MIQKIAQHLQIYKGMQPIGWMYVGKYKETLWTRTQKADRETGC